MLMQVHNKYHVYMYHNILQNLLMLPRTMLTVVETVKNDNVYCRFIQFTVVN